MIEIDINSWQMLMLVLKLPFAKCTTWVDVFMVGLQFSAGIALMMAAHCRLDKMNGDVPWYHVVSYAGMAVGALVFALRPWLFGMMPTWHMIGLVGFCAGVLWGNASAWEDGPPRNMKREKTDELGSTAGVPGAANSSTIDMAGARSRLRPGGGSGADPRSSRSRDDVFGDDRGRHRSPVP